MNGDPGDSIIRRTRKASVTERTRSIVRKKMEKKTSHRIKRIDEPNQKLWKMQKTNILEYAKNPTK